MSLIKGEYWVTDTNDVIYADGSIGDFTHESYAKEAGIALLLGMFGLDFPDQGHITDPLEFIAGAHREELLPWDSQKGPPTIQVLIEKILNLKPTVPEYDEILDLVAALNSPDITRYFVEKKGWVYVQGDYLAMETFDADRLVRVMNEVLEAEGIDDDEINEFYADRHVTVFFRKEGLRLEYPIQDHVNGVKLEHPTPVIPRVIYVPPPQKVPIVAAVRKLDHEGMHSFYRQRGYPYVSSD